MARTKDVVLTPEQKELKEKEYLDFVKPSTYGNKANPSSCNSLYDDVENPELRAIVEKVAATTPYREETSTNEAQSPPNPQKRISGKQRKATLEEYQQTFLQVPRIDDRKPVFVSSDVRDRLDRVVRILGGRRMSVSGIIGREKCNWSQTTTHVSSNGTNMLQNANAVPVWMVAMVAKSLAFTTRTIPVERVSE